MNCKIDMPDQERSPQRVLLADDEPAFTILVERLLAEAGFEVLQAHSMEEALEKALSFRPHVALLDVHMPGDGIHACEALATELDPAPAIIMVTGSYSGELLNRAMAAGASDYINKPINWEELVPLIESHMEPTIRSWSAR